MKNLIVLSAIAFILASCQSKNLPTVVDIRPDFVEIKFSHLTTKDEMAKIKAQLKSTSNIDMLYDQSQFLEDGQLQLLNIGVQLPDGTRGSTTADLLTLQYKYYGFRYDPKGKPSFKVGIM